MNRMISMVIRIFIAQVMRRGINRGLGGMMGGRGRGGGGQRQRLDNRSQHRANPDGEAPSKAPPAGQVGDAPPPQQPRPADEAARSQGDAGKADTDR